VMHPGPMNRGIEIASDVADGTRSLILDQVANGLAVRMAVLYLLAGGSALAQAQTRAEASDAAEQRRDKANKNAAQLALLEPVPAG